MGTIPRPIPTYDQSLLMQTQQQSSNRASDSANLLVACQLEDTTSNDWFADSGATEHMSFQRKWFTNFVEFPSNTYSVRVGEGTRVDAKGRDDIQVISSGTDINHQVYTIKDVLYVPKIEKNLVSVSQTTKKGIKVLFEENGDQVVFQKDNKLMITGTRFKKLYKLNIKALTSAEANTTTGE